MESETLQDTVFIMFENKSNNCWLDASMALIAHNKAIKKIASSSPDSKIKEIISAYEEAVTFLNDSDKDIEHRIKTAREKLIYIQASILQYLQPILKYKIGEPDSAFCALLNLIYESKSIKEHLNISWYWKKLCSNCGNSSKSSPSVKPIITLSKVNNFEPDCPTSLFICSCKTEQEMKLIYKQLPPCLFFHFENGAGNGNMPPLIFTIQDRKYQLTGVITLEKSQDASVNHFITWIRDPFADKWLECNDLNTDIISFSPEHPQFDLKDVYMYIFESFDNLNKVSNEMPAEHFQEQDLESAVELIDLSDESEDINSGSNVSASADSIKNIETSVANLIIHDRLDHSNQDASEEEKSVCKGLDESTFISTQNLKAHGEKYHLDVSSNGKSGIPDCKTDYISNLRFNHPKKQGKSGINSRRQQRKLDSESSFINRDETEEGPVSCEIQTDASHTSEFKNKNVIENMGKEYHLRSEVGVTRKDVQNKGNGQNKNTAVDLAFEYKPSLLVGSPNFSDKSKFKSTFSDTSNKVDDTQGYSPCQKGSLIFSKAKDNSLVMNELCSIQKNSTKEQLKGNESQFSDTSSKSSSRKRKLTEQLTKDPAKKSSLGMEDRQSVILPLKVMVQPKTEENKILDFDEHELQIRMQQALLKKDDSQCVNTNRSKVLNTNEEGYIMVNSSKTNVKKSEKCDKIDQIQANDGAEHEVLSDVSRERVNSISCSASLMMENLLKSPKRKSVSNKSSSSGTSSNKKETIEDVRGLVNGVVESTFASFLEQIFFKKQGSLP